MLYFSHDSAFRFAFTRIVSLLLAAWTALTSTAVAADPRPLKQAHAHNDYLHARPLLDALELGFCSVEADVFLVDGKLLVAHERKELSADRSLRKLYLDPLQLRVTANKGSVYGERETFILMIDIKDDARATYLALDKLLSEYAEMLNRVENEQLQPGPVKIVLSGNRDFELVLADKTRFVGLDGRLSNMNSDLPATALPMISDNWGLHFRWNGMGAISDEEKDKLATYVAEAHQRGRLLRMWATPDTEAAWQVLYESGVDLINTDDLNGLSQFLKSKESAR